MKIRDIVEAYCNRYDLQLILGKMGDNDPAPILPFIIMDSALSEFSREVRPLKFRREMKAVRKRWSEDYHAFNRRLFSCLNQEQTDFVVDLMDEYEDAVRNEVMFMRVALMDLVSGCDFKTQKIIASLMLCNVFSQVAQLAWGLVFQTTKRNPQRCPELDRLKNYSHKMANGVFLLPDNVNPNASPKLNAAVESYMNKTVKWLKSYDRER